MRDAGCAPSQAISDGVPMVKRVDTDLLPLDAVADRCGPAQPLIFMDNAAMSSSLPLVTPFPLST
jgi:hypothetical protein